MTETHLPELATLRVVGGVDHLADLANVTVSPLMQRRVARAYGFLPSWDPDAVPVWSAFAAETMAQADALRRMGLRIVVQDSDPYRRAADMITDVREERTIRVLATAVTGGHPYLTDEQNDTFRAVHDVLGHAAAGRGFDRHGEEAAYLAHRRCYSPLARLALATETRGQNAFLITFGVFGEQKLAVLPGWARDPRALEPQPDERPATVAQAQAFHSAAGLVGAVR